VPPGWLGLTYMVLYPISQLIVFNWRTDYETPVLLWGLKQAQLTSLFVLVVVVPLLLVAWYRSERRVGRVQVS
jgi:prolipoprotein diacylglyceryltransferase